MKTSLIAAATRRFTRKKSDDANASGPTTTISTSATPGKLAATGIGSLPTTKSAAHVNSASLQATPASGKFPKQCTRLFSFRKPVSNNKQNEMIKSKEPLVQNNGGASSDRKIGHATGQKGHSLHHNSDHIEVVKVKKSASEIAASSTSAKLPKQKSSMTMPNGNQFSRGKKLTPPLVSSSTSAISKMSTAHRKAKGASGDDTGSNQLPTQQEMTTRRSLSAADIIAADAAESLLKNIGREQHKSTGVCPLDKILEFLQAIVYKDYKLALVLAQEVLQYEPDNDIMREYLSVLSEMTGTKAGTGSGDSSSLEDETSSSSESEDTSTGDSTSSETTSSSESDDSSEEEESESSGESHASSSPEDDKKDIKKTIEDLQQEFELLMTRNVKNTVSEKQTLQVDEETGCGKVNEKLVEEHFDCDFKNVLGILGKANE